MAVPHDPGPVVAAQQALVGSASDGTGAATGATCEPLADPRLVSWEAVGSPGITLSETTSVEVSVMTSEAEGQAMVIARADGMEPGIALVTTPFFTSCPAERLPGDFNGDRRVDQADYAEWRATDGTAQGYADWLRNLGKVCIGE